MRPLAPVRRAALAAVLAAGAVTPATGTAPAVATYRVEDGGIAEPLTDRPGDPARGRAIVIDPERGNCLICHAVPDAPGERFQGNLGPPLAGVGARLDEATLRLRIVDGTRLDPDTVMPAYHRVTGLNRVAREWQGRPVLDAQAVEDVVSYLRSLDGRGG